MIVARDPLLVPGRRRTVLLLTRRTASYVFPDMWFTDFVDVDASGKTLPLECVMSREPLQRVGHTPAVILCFGPDANKLWRLGRIDSAEAFFSTSAGQTDWFFFAHGSFMRWTFAKLLETIQ